jgi:hypothetical protein
MMASPDRVFSLLDSLFGYFTLLIIGIALISGIVWYYIDSSNSIFVISSILIIACPCAIALSVPFTYGNSMRILGRKSLYLRTTRVIEPIDGRYWLALGNKIFVLSAFQGSNIVGWSVYEPGFHVDEMVAREDKVYLRSGNKVYVYGGTAGTTDDDCEVVVELPYLDANKPATYKEAKGIDATIQGTWQISMGFDHTNPEARDIIATPTQPTFALGKIPATGIGTHFGMRLTNEAAGYARLANIIVHYDEMHSKHDAG